LSCRIRPLESLPLVTSHHGHLVTQHFALQGENLLPSFEMRNLSDVVISSCATCAIDSLAGKKQLIWHGHNLPQVRSSGKQCLSVFAPAAVLRVEKAAA